jgi:hypothetical protein
MKSTKAAIWATAGVVGAGVIGGVTYAAVSTPAVASSQQLGAAADSVLANVQAGNGQPGGGAGAGRFGRRALLQRIEHGELTLQVRNGTKTVDLQRGTASGVSPTSITVTSPDGFKATYVVTGDTKVRTRTGLQSISVVHDNDKVFVIAVGGKAMRILDRGH